MEREAGFVVEGFVCPMCYQEFHSSPQLMEHFEGAHSGGESGGGGSAGGGGGKKGKKGKEDEDERAYTRVYWEPQEMGKR